MMLGMSLSTFTTVHVIISLVGIGSGLIVIFGMLSAKRLNGWTALFLLTTVLTSVTGFGFPFTHVTPGHKVGSSRWWCWRLRSWRATASTWLGNGAGFTW